MGNKRSSDFRWAPEKDLAKKAKNPLKKERDKAIIKGTKKASSASLNKNALNILSSIIEERADEKQKEELTKAITKIKKAKATNSANSKNYVFNILFPIIREKADDKQIKELSKEFTNSIVAVTGNKKTGKADSEDDESQNIISSALSFLLGQTFSFTCKELKKAATRKPKAEKLQNTNLANLDNGLAPVFSAYFTSTRVYGVYALAFVMSLLAITYFINAINAFISSFDIASFGISLWIGIVALIDAFGLWKILLPFRKIRPGDTKAFTGFMSVQKILNVISFVLCEIVAATLLTASIALMIASDKIVDLLSAGIIQIGDVSGDNVVVNADVIHGFLSSLPSVLFISSIFVSAVAAVSFAFYNRAIKSFLSYIDDLSVSIESNIYRIEKEPPYTSFLVFGGLSIVGGFLSILLFAQLNNIFLIDFSISTMIALMLSVLFGLYLISTAVLFRALHKKATSESARLDGLAAHMFIELCDLDNLYQNGVDAEIDRLVAEGALTSQFASRIRREEIETFRNSQIFADMREAKELHREYSIKSETGTSIIDCIIVKENGDIKIAEFKTDRQPEEQFIEEYSSQLSRYRKAVEQYFDVPPASMEVYSFYLGKSIPMQIND